jgi:hypothetical protein
MVFLVSGTRYLKTESAHSLEEAVKKVMLNVDGKWCTPTMSALSMHSSLSVDEIRNKFKHTR